MTYAHCPTMGLACSTAALKHGCRCATCAPWYAAHLQERREGRPEKVIHAPSPTCPVHHCKASTAFRTKRCRCDTCKVLNYEMVALAMLPAVQRLIARTHRIEDRLEALEAPQSTAKDPS